MLPPDLLPDLLSGRDDGAEDGLGVFRRDERLMAIPNLIAVFLLSGVVVKLVRSTSPEKERTPEGVFEKKT